MDSRVTNAVLFALWLLAGVPPARGEARLCLQVAAPEAERESLRRLVLDELGHHPSHRLVEAGCETRLKVELFKLENSWYITVRAGEQVPVRHYLKNLSDLDHRLRDAISQALGHDPVFLADDITRFSAVQRVAHSVLKRGANFWRIELFQGLGRGVGSLVLAPGGAVSLNRGADHWQVFARVFVAGWPGRPTGENVELSVHTGAEGGLTYEFSELGWSSFYASVAVGLEYRRYRGLLDPADPGSMDYRNDFGPAATVRAGIRLLRYYSFDCDVFVMGRFPLYPADLDTELNRFYPVDVQLGLGVGF